MSFVNIHKTSKPLKFLFKRHHAAGIFLCFGIPLFTHTYVFLDSLVLLGAIDREEIRNSFLGKIFQEFRVDTEGKIIGRAQPPDWKPWEFDIIEFFSHTC